MALPPFIPSFAVEGYPSPKPPKAGADVEHPTLTPPKPPNPAKASDNSAFRAATLDGLAGGCTNSVHPENDAGRNTPLTRDLAFDGIFHGFDRVVATLVVEESAAEKLHNDRIAEADRWTPAPVALTQKDTAAWVGGAYRPANGAFLHVYTASDAERISQSRALILDLETTGLSSFGEEVKSVGRVGHRRFRRPRPVELDGFFPQVPANFGSYYMDDFPKCYIDTTRRVRIITVRSIDDGWTAAWDLDHLALEARQRLAHDVLSGKIVIGHNISFDLAWLRWLTNAEPARVIDSMLVAKWHAHASRLNVHMRAATGDEACASLVKTAGPGAELASAWMTAQRRLGCRYRIKYSSFRAIGASAIYPPSTMHIVPVTLTCHSGSFTAHLD